MTELGDKQELLGKYNALRSSVDPEINRSIPLNVPERAKIIQHITSIATARIFREKQNADIDPLTGVFNRRVLDQRIDEAINRHGHNGTRFAMVIMDLDGFKKYNDKYGHAEGDMILKNFAKYAKQKTRESDVFARYGGDEFVLLLESPGPNTGDRIQESFTDYFSKLANKDPRARYLAVSLGLAMLEPGENLTAAEWHNHADAAMYNSKGIVGTHLVKWKPGMVNPNTIK